MTRSGKAALLSALIYPGIGHLYLRQFARGWVLIAITSISLGYIVAQLVGAAMDIADRMISGSVATDTDTLTGLLMEQISGGLYPVAAWSIAICWLWGVVDAYRIGRGQENVGAR